MKQILKNKKAITLIALVITIVVLIILAGVIISITLGNGGIIDRAKTAKEQYQNAQDYEEKEIAKYSNEIESYVSGNREEKQWTEIGRTTGNNHIKFDATKYKELHFIVYSSINDIYAISENVLTRYLTANKMQFMTYYSDSYYVSARINNQEIHIGSARDNNEDVTSTYTLILYGK